MSVVALVIVPSIAMTNSTTQVIVEAEVWVDRNEKEHITTTKDAKFIDETNHKSAEVKVEMTTNENGSTKAIVTTTTIKDHKAFVTEEIIEGAADEVKSKVEAIKENNNHHKKG